jgi:hypothetical protein
LNALSGVSVLFGNLSDVPGPGIGGAIIVAKIALMPVVALAALFFAVRGRVLYAIRALALAQLLTWLSFLPPITVNGLALTGTEGAVTIYLAVMIPILALAAIILSCAGG